MFFHVRHFYVSFLVAFLITPFLYASIIVSHAQIRQSTNYRIESDSVNFAGGLASSTNYSLESTLGEIATGESNSTGYALKAGYQQMVNNFISISGVSNVSLTPSIVGITGGTSNGSTTVIVTTDSPAGYDLSISASLDPALQSGSDSIADYAPVGANPDYSFITDTDDAQFGYSPSGVDTVARFMDDGASLCNTGSSETLLACWDGLDTSAESIARASSANTPDGATTTIYFRVGIGSGVVQPSGIYTATTTITAISL